ncbi:hypothetical protein SCHPADRAFT_996519 [Schizopora paradoxa]|uniref:Uncharacterized protein n=1 Tax=Schizopora paradoxa TaxID=27342 RepID=A0A0H2RYH7_9AGAM|nr:hypothetical protein SCHPADRAFT_996519 [Schizopora paradoxa]
MAWIGYATPQAKRIVMSVFGDHITSFAGPSSEALLSTRQIYEAAIRTKETTKAYVPPRPQEMMHKKTSGKIVAKSWPPNDKHPIRSMRYLKQVVLTDLEERGLVEKVHRKRPPTEIEKQVLDSKLKARNKGRSINKLAPIEPGDNVSEWLWRKRVGADTKWVEEESSVEKLEGKYRSSYYWPDNQNKWGSSVGSVDKQKRSRQ